jgi:3-oxoacyl-[acyl-carrier protein] reductase
MSAGESPVAPALDGRGAIVTGASLGLGRAIAAAFVRAGAGVLLVARDASRLARTREDLAGLVVRGGQVVRAFAADVGRPEAAAAVAAEAARHVPNLQILVNNAGIYGPLGRFEEVSWDDWTEAIRVNLFGTALMCRALVPAFRRARYGKIVNLSGGGATAPLPRISAYAAAKAAVVRLTETLAAELADDHVDVNAIAPGALNTRLLDQVLAAGPDRVGAGFHARAVRQRAEGGAPLDKAAGLAVFLASAASDGITGRLISAVWDDWTGLPGRREALAASDVFTLRRVAPRDRGLEW